MSLTLKDCVNPWKAADKNLLVSGLLSIGEMDRLAEVVLEDGGDVGVELEFERNEDKLPILRGSIQTTLILQCQRCMQPMELPVNTDFSMAFIQAGSLAEAETDTGDSHLSAHYDLCEIEDERVCLTDVIEDELLLLLPQVPMHSAPACVIKTEFGDSEIKKAAEEKENPFAVLASLKDKLNS